MNHTTTVLIMLLWLGTPLFSYDADLDRNVPLKTLLQAARESYFQKNYFSANEMLTQAEKAEPKNFQVLLLLGEVAYFQKKYKLAYKYLLRARRVDKNSPRMLIFAGLSRKEMGKSYIKLIRTGLLKSPDMKEGQWPFVEYQIRKFKKKGREDSDRFLGLNPQPSPAVDLLKGFLAFKDGYYVKAQNLLEKHLPVYKKVSPTGRRVLALVYRELGLLDKSSAELNSIQSESKQEGDPMENLLLLYKNSLANGDLHTAMSHLKKMRTLNNKRAERYRNDDVELYYAELLEQMGHTEKAKRAYLKAFTKDDNLKAGIKAYEILYRDLDDYAGLSGRNKRQLKKLEKMLKSLTRIARKKANRDSSESSEIPGLKEDLNTWKSQKRTQEIDQFIDSLNFKKAFASIKSQQKSGYSREVAEKEAALHEKMADFTKAGRVWRKLNKKGMISDFELDNRLDHLKAQKRDHREIDLWRKLADNFEDAGRERDAKKYRKKADKAEAKLYKKSRKKRKRDSYK